MEEETQEITEVVEGVVETVPVEELLVQELPVEIIADLGFWITSWNVYTFVLDWFFPTMLIIGGFIALRFLIWNSLKFNYYHYLKHGEFVLAWGDDGNEQEKINRRKKIARDIKCDPDFVSWFGALLMSVVVLVGHGLIALFWPITIILILPLMAVRAIGYRKRRKIVFVQKINGDHLNESV